MRRPLRFGCSLLIALSAILIVAVGIVLWFATRDIGPEYHDGVYTVHGVAASQRADRISPAAARRFDSKRDVRPEPQEIARVQLQGIDFSEEEVNSKLAEELSARPLDAGGVHVERIFLELHPQGTRAYMYTSMYGVRVTFWSPVSFSVANNTGQVQLRSPHAGRLPIGLLLPSILSWTGNTVRVRQMLELALPPVVSGVQPREGALHVSVNVFRLTRRQNGASLAAGTRPGAGSSADAIRGVSYAGRSVRGVLRAGRLRLGAPDAGPSSLTSPLPSRASAVALPAGAFSAVAAAALGCSRSPAGASSGAGVLSADASSTPVPAVSMLAWAGRGWPPRCG